MKYNVKVFENGLKLVTISGLSSNAATIAAYVKAGFRFDFKDKPGISHFTEHIIFNSTTNSPKFNKQVRDIESNGGWRSAFTWIEHQEHIVHLPIDNLEKGLRLILESIFEPYITAPEVDKEKGVIKEEILRNKADPSRAIWDYAWHPLFFQKTKLARPYSGTIANIELISEIDIEKFTSKYFNPNNIVLFVAGNIIPAKIEELSYKYINKYKSTHLPKKITPLVPKIENRVFVNHDPTYYQTSLAIGIKTVPFDSSLKYRFDILRDMLAGYFSSPLIQKLRDEGGLIYTWDSFHDTLKDTGYLVFIVSIAHENVNKVAKLVLQEFERFTAGNFSDEEVEMAKNHLIGSILANTETGQDYIRWYGLKELLNDKLVFHIDKQLDIYKKITCNEIKEIAAKYFAKENRFIAAIGSADLDSLSKLLTKPT